MNALASPLHPAQKRRIAAQMPPLAPHDIVLAPLGRGGERTIIATYDAQDFIEALFEDLKAPDWQNRLSVLRRRRVGDDGTLELGLPIHRNFQIALFEAYCPTPGSPRVDPAKISGQGMVLRRQGRSGPEGWNKSGKIFYGWRGILSPDADPNQHPATQGHSANAAARKLIAARLPAPAVQGAETILPLFIAPPDVCAAMGRTIFYGIIPVVSAERSDLASPEPIIYSALPSETRAELVGHFSEYLKARPVLSMPRAGVILTPDWNVLDRPTDTDSARLNALGIFLQQSLVELDLLGTGAAAHRLMSLLATIHLPTQRNGAGTVTASIDAASFIASAAPILIGREANADAFAMPLEWPRVEDILGQKLTEAALDCLTERHAALVGPPAKFENASDLFAIRGFVRTKGHDACGDRIIWSSVASEPFRVLPWWDGEGPGTTISLPDLSNLKRVKPSVAFAMPPAIANLMNADPRKMVKGDGTKADSEGAGLGWLCSFSIPFITICAFIVLNIFLSLFDIIFRWMMFIKLCIPIPKK